MGIIICATRGGEASERTQEAAIQLAKERGDETFPVRLELAKARSISKLLRIDSKLALAKFGQNPLHDKEVERTYEEIHPVLKQLSDSLITLCDQIG